MLMLLAFCSYRVRAESIYLKNAIVHTISGATITNGGVLIEDNKIKLVTDDAQSQEVNADKVIDLKGEHLYPGLIALDSAVGLTEIEAIRATQDTTEVGDFTPDVQSWIAVNPDSELIPVARANGIAHVEPVPQGGIVAGMSGVITLDGWTTEQMTLQHPSALHLYWPRMDLDTRPKEKWRNQERYKSIEEQSRERRTKLKELDDFFQEARAYAKLRDAVAKKTATDPGINPPWEAMLPVIRGEVPIMVHANELRQIKAAAKWAKTNDFKIVIVGGRDAPLCAEMLAAQRIPVIYEFTWAVPDHDWSGYDVNFRGSEAMRKAGVKVAFSMGNSSFNAALAKNLPYSASQAVAFGMPEEEALKGITLYPAQILRLDQRLGSIEPGKEATLFACDGDILDLRANVQHLWIAGKEVSLENRHTRLYEKYKNRPRAK